MFLIIASLDTDSCRHVQGPTWGYPTEGAYYRDASSVDSLLAIRIPFFALHAEDDPVSSGCFVKVNTLHMLIMV